MDWRAVMRFCRACYFTIAEHRFTRGLSLGRALLRNRALHNGRTPLYTRITAWLRFAAQSGIAQWPRTASHADYRLAVLCAQSCITQRPHTDSHADYSLAVLCAQSCITQRPHAASHADYRLAALCCAIGHRTMAAHRFTRGLQLGCALMRSRVSKLSTHSAQPHIEAQSYRTRAPPPACAALYPRTNAKTRTFRFKRNDAGAMGNPYAAVCTEISVNIYASRLSICTLRKNFFADSAIARARSSPPRTNRTARTRSPGPHISNSLLHKLY